MILKGYVGLKAANTVGGEVLTGRSRSEADATTDDFLSSWQFSLFIRYFTRNEQHSLMVNLCSLDGYNQRFVYVISARLLLETGLSEMVPTFPSLSPCGALRFTPGQ